MQSRVDRIELDRLIFKSNRDKYLKQAIDYLLEDREYLKINASRNLIRMPIVE